MICVEEICILSFPNCSWAFPSCFRSLEFHIQHKVGTWVCALNQLQPFGNTGYVILEILCCWLCTGVRTRRPLFVQFFFHWVDYGRFPIVVKMDILQRLHMISHLMQDRGYVWPQPQSDSTGQLPINFNKLFIWSVRVLLEDLRGWTCCSSRMLPSAVCNWLWTSFTVGGRIDWVKVVARKGRILWKFWIWLFWSSVNLIWLVWPWGSKFTKDVSELSELVSEMWHSWYFGV